jgi:hypothetical protein
LCQALTELGDDHVYLGLEVDEDGEDVILVASTTTLGNAVGSRGTDGRCADEEARGEQEKEERDDAGVLHVVETMGCCCCWVERWSSMGTKSWKKGLVLYHARGSHIPQDCRFPEE